MSGPGYRLPNVPDVMFFYKAYALHGTYWHNNFGQPMSHGCVNLRTEDARWLYEWSGPVVPAGKNSVRASDENPGTLVVVHY
jgi:lipoprotein-anchoring transpeptidase ErfK/SrfK